MLSIVMRLGVVKSCVKRAEDVIGNVKKMQVQCNPKAQPFAILIITVGDEGEKVAQRISHDAARAKSGKSLLPAAISWLFLVLFDIHVHKSQPCSAHA